MRMGWKLQIVQENLQTLNLQIECACPLWIQMDSVLQLSMCDKPESLPVSDVISKDITRHE